MKALVTGASGFIGSHLVELLIQEGFEVTCLTRKTTNLKWINQLDVKLLVGDLSYSGTFFDKIVHFDYIFHLAGLTKAVSKKDFFQANAENTNNLLQAVRKKNPGIVRFIYLSSLAAVGPSIDSRPVDEDSPPKPVSLYGESKLAGEKVVLEFSNTIPSTVLRPPAVYGPRDTDFFVLFQSIQKGFYPKWGKCYYTLLYVEDLARGILLAAERKEAEGKTFFLSDPRLYSGEDIVNEIARALKCNPVGVRLPRTIMPLLAYIGEKLTKGGIINRDKVREIFHANWTCHSRKAQEELGFQSRVALREGIQWTADWYQKHQWL